ncbi:hypothetical protein [Crateriforma conspicua]|nr:hypothetical protein [Crateriforma conspicua]
MQVLIACFGTPGLYAKWWRRWQLRYSFIATLIDAFVRESL